MDETKNRRMGWPVSAVAACVVLPLLYVLSVGPVFWLSDRDWISTKTFSDRILPIYVPLEIAAGKFPPLAMFLNWYLELVTLPLVESRIAPVPPPAARKIIAPIDDPSEAKSVLVGTVLGPDGKPAANVDIWMSYNMKSMNLDGRSADGLWVGKGFEFGGTIATATTDALGKFQIERDYLPIELEARPADGKSTAHAEVAEWETEVTLELQPTILPTAFP